ncbi:hypothetical protein PMAYCL1PPCAC_24664 [Pristionchus mayeri]|uniref:G protein-coupled receptor n=1 Tax=Pristionchus mayeri TaxID=1317129 RepID=A0AAN5D157_9BILA|nr:hypothetical protein PMAYCL1PPCAC_24664 [Pristionchus mayeri]
MALAMDILDYGLLVVNLYVLLRIGISRDDEFKSPFFYWFLVTGIASSISVVGFIIAVRFTFPEEQAWGFKFGDIMNAICVTFATIGKTIISFHRYSVMLNASLVENIWSSRMSYILTCIVFIISIATCSSAFWCGLTYKVVENVTVVVYLDDACILVQKSRSSVIYFLFVIVALTALTRREFVKIGRLAQNSTKTLIMIFQISETCS